MKFKQWVKTTRIFFFFFCITFFVVLEQQFCTFIPKKYVAIWKTRKTRSKCIYQKDFQYGKKHQNACHHASSTYHLIVAQCIDDGDIIDNQITQWTRVEHKYLLDVIKGLRYLARQGIPLPGLDNNDNLTQFCISSGQKTIT